MLQFSSYRDTAARTARLPLAYLTVATTYILVSTYFSGQFVDYDPGVLRVEIVKGIGFVAVTAAVLWLILYRQYRLRRLSEVTFRSLVENVPDAVFIVRIPERIIQYVNPGAQRMFGYTEAEFVGSNSEKLYVDHASYLRFGEESQRVLYSGQPFRREFAMRRKSGEVFPTEHIVSLITSLGDSYVVSVVRDTTEREAQAAAVRESEARFRQIAENLREVFWISNPDKTEMQYVSPAYAEIWGRSIDELYRNPRSFLDAVHPDDREHVLDRALRQATDEYDVQYRIVRPDGDVRWIWDRAVPIRQDDGSVDRIVGIAEDITQMKGREEELIQAKKMEAVGHLAGGIAHDFNNMLTVILGNAELLLEASAGRPDERELAERIARAGDRASDLTRRLLAFSRQQPLAAGPIDLNALIREVSGLLARTLGEDVSIEMRLATDLWPVAADKAQMEASLLNLAINARDAMEGGGALLIETSNATFEGHGRVRAGDYVVLAVTDTGTGMPADVAARVFDPFFTTKEPGKGTGLGLSMMHGFVVQSGGHVDVRTAPGEGTTFRLYLPRHGRPPDEDAPLEIGPLPRGSEKVLVVEDDPLVRELVVGQLRGLGYRVIEASDGKSASTLVERHPDIELVLTDVIMPGGMSGPSLAAELARRRPDLPVLFMSGYGARAELKRAGLPADVAVLRKPYRLADLAGRVRTALDGGA